MKIKKIFMSSTWLYIRMMIIEVLSYSNKENIHRKNDNAVNHLLYHSKRVCEGAMTGSKL